MAYRLTACRSTAELREIEPSLYACSRSLIKVNSLINLLRISRVWLAIYKYGDSFYLRHLVELSNHGYSDFELELAFADARNS